MRTRVRRWLARQVFRHLEPEMGELRKMRGYHWRLVSVELGVHAHGYGRSELVLRYVPPADLAELSRGWPSWR